MRLVLACSALPRHSQPREEGLATVPLKPPGPPGAYSSSEISILDQHPSAKPASAPPWFSGQILFFQLPPGAGLPSDLEGPTQGSCLPHAEATSVLRVPILGWCSVDRNTSRDLVKMPMSICQSQYLHIPYP